MRVSQASAVVVHRVPPDAVEWFMGWERDVTAAAEAFEGYRGTDLFPPATDDTAGEWVAVLHFENQPHMQRWLDSPERAELLKQLRKRIKQFDVQVLPEGFGPWFASGRGGAKPAGWKMVSVVLLGLYPTVMLLSIFVAPWTNRWGTAVSMLIGNLMSVSILQYAVMPMLSRAFGPWLRTEPRRQPGRTVMGAALIAGLLTALTLAFQHAVG